MSTKDLDRDLKFKTDDERLLELWDDVQRVQTDFCFAQEITAYYTSFKWIDRAHSVLDVGTGNGYFIGKLIDLFPDKTYTGIDISHELVEIARHDLVGKQIELRTENFFDAQGTSDFVITRLFWQHLKANEVATATEKLLELTEPGGTVLIMDAADDLRCFVPELPALREVISEYSEQQHRTGRERNIVPDVVHRMCGSGAWSQAAHFELILPSSIAGYLDLYRHIYTRWLDLFDLLGELRPELLRSARGELGNWIKKDNAYTHAGIRVVQLDRAR